MQPDLFTLEPPACTASARLVRLELDVSGESIAIAVVGQFDSGKPFARAVTTRVLKCLPQELGYACYSFGSLLVADYLSTPDGQHWHPPLAGINVGPSFSVEADDEESTIHTALERCALFHPAASPQIEPVSVGDPMPRPAEESRFVHAVRTEVLQRKPTLEPGFNRPFSLTGASSGFSIDYIGHSYATCYAAINPKGRSPVRLRTASAALWRLARARDAFGFATPDRVELTAWIPAPGLPIYRDSEYAALEDAVAELRAQAHREHLQVFTAHDILSASRRLINEELMTVN
ncbi:hypothetical protein RI103_02440 [Paraburkholderia sp. FT54]|uniref:hypothetical protein n=1 Tax=Paraburkholderia sp. FT54 TaxID=3074437 RepID=UPI00287795FA|nr:hypothetical protein [Paraburkholderia sp. FT54]WNC90240.1 hypothetical protein RI103_02440 [Paraburkholderia sp. FT54]